MKFILGLLLFSLLFRTTSAYSAEGPLQLNVTDYGWITSFPVLQPLLDDYLQTVEDDLNADQPIRNPSEIMKSTANSTALASTAIGSDYGMELRRYLVGVSVSVAADLEEDKGLEDTVSGLGATGAIIVGKKLDEENDLFFNIGGINHSRNIPGILETKINAEITSFSIGAHLRHRLIEESGTSMLGWGGLKIHLGYEYTSNKLEFEDFLNEELNVDLGGAAVVEGRVKGFPQYEITSKIHSFPIELSSNVQFLKLFTLFGGTGADINFGNAKGKGDVKARVFSPLTCASGVCTNLNLPEVEATANLNRTEKVNPFILRAFGGLQLNFGDFKVYGMATQMLGTKILGVSAGVRATF